MKVRLSVQQAGQQGDSARLMDHITLVDEEVSAMARKRLEKDGVADHRCHTVRDNTVYYELRNRGQHQKPTPYSWPWATVMGHTSGLGNPGRRPDANRCRHCDGRKAPAHQCASIYAIGDVNAKVMLAYRL